MDRKWISSTLLPLAGMLGVLLIDYGCAQLDLALIRRNSQFFDVSYYFLWFYTLEAIFSFGSMLMLFWVILTRVPRSSWLGWLFLTAGVLLVFFPEIYFYTPSWIGWALPDYLSEIPPDSIFYMAGAGIGLIGLFSLVLPRKV